MFLVKRFLESLSKKHTCYFLLAKNTYFQKKKKKEKLVEYTWKVSL